MAHRTSTVDEVPADSLGEVVAESITDLLAAATVELSYAPKGAALTLPAPEVGTAMATGAGPKGWQTTVIVRLDDRVARLLGTGDRTSLAELLEALPRAAVVASAQFRHHDGDDPFAPLSPALRRALRDTVAAEILSSYLARRVGRRDGC